MFVDELDDGAQKNRECLSCARGGIHQSTLAADDMLPGFLLVGKGPQLFGCEPIVYNNKAFCGRQRFDG